MVGAVCSARNVMQPPSCQTQEMHACDTALNTSMSVSVGRPRNTMESALISSLENEYSLFFHEAAGMARSMTFFVTVAVFGNTKLRTTSSSVPEFVTLGVSPVVTVPIFT